LDTEPLPSGVEDRARDLLKLKDVEREPRALPIRNDWLWRAEHFAPRVPYTGSFLLPMGHKPDFGPIAAAITALIGRHEALRSELAVENDIPILLPVHSESSLACVPVSKSDIAAQREGRVSQDLAEFFSKPIDLFEQPGFRAQAFMDEDGDVSLGILMHHYYGDAWSSQIVRREIVALHVAQLGQQAPPPPPAAQYSDYGLFQRRALEKSLTRQLTYWRRTLSDMPAARLPYDSQDETGMLGRVFFLVEDDVMRRLDELAKAQRISLGLVCYAALQIVIARWCGQTGMVTGLIAANRIRPQFQGTVGSLLSIIPVASRISPGDPFRTFLMGFAKNVFDGIAHQDISVDNYNEIFLPPDPLGVPRFNFIPRQENFFVGAWEQTPAISGVMPSTDIRRNSAYTDLHFLMLEYPEGLLGRVVFAKTLSFTAIKAMVDMYQAILKRIAAEPDSVLASLV
jgi:iturin family lipopeptide synthetase A